MHASTALARHKQDLRSADAQDAATKARGAHPSASSSQAVAPVVATKPADGGSGVDWMPIGLALAGGRLAVGGAGALSTRRVRRQHRTAL